MLKEDGFNTLEIRALRSQRNFEEFILEAKLFMKRIEYLEKELATKNNPIEQPKFNKDEVITDSLEALESETKVLQALANYCKKLDIDPEPYIKMAAEYRSELFKTFERDKITQ
jgi:small-conductance mechanosensitive channel